MYSASIAPHFRGLPARVRAGCAYLLTDPSYAPSIARYERETERAAGDGDEDGTREGGGTTRTRRPYYFLGVGGTLWAVWQAGTAAAVTAWRTGNC